MKRGLVARNVVKLVDRPPMEYREYDEALASAGNVLVGGASNASTKLS